MRTRHRVSKLLLRQGIVYKGGTTWSGVHEAWLGRQKFDSPARQFAWESSLEALHAVGDRRDRLDEEIARMAY